MENSSKALKLGRLTEIVNCLLKQFPLGGDRTHIFLNRYFSCSAIELLAASAFLIMLMTIITIPLEVKYIRGSKILLAPSPGLDQLSF